MRKHAERPQWTNLSHRDHYKTASHSWPRLTAQTRTDPATSVKNHSVEPGPKGQLTKTWIIKEVRVRPPGFRAGHCILKLMPGRLCNLGEDTKQGRYQINDQANSCCDMLHSGHKQAKVIDKDYLWVAKWENISEVEIFFAGIQRKRRSWLGEALRWKKL